VPHIIARIATTLGCQLSALGAKRKRRFQKSARRRLFVEGLEDRRLMALVGRIVEDGVLGGGINNGDIDADPSAVVDVNGVGYFSATDGIHGDELWRIGTNGFAQMVEDAIPGGGIASGALSSSPRELINVGGTLYFSADDGVNGIELWRVNGAGAAELVEDTVVPGGGISTSSSSSPRYLTNVEGTLYFVANDQLNGNEIWRVGSSGFAELVEDSIAGGGIRPSVVGSNPKSLTAVSGQLFFIANDGTTGYEVWRIPNGGNASLVEDSIPGNGIPVIDEIGIVDVGYLTNFSGTLYFSANNSVHGRELWRVAGSGIASMVEDAGGSVGDGIGIGDNGSYPASITSSNGTLYFQASVSGIGVELWRINAIGTAELVEDAIPDGGINPGSGNSYPNYLTDVAGTLYFSAGNNTDGNELWRINTSGIAEIVSRSGATGIANGVRGSNPAYLTNVSGTLYFSAEESANEKILWRIQNGSAQLVEDEFPAVGISLDNGLNAPQLTNVGGQLFFVARNSSVGAELFRVDSSGIAKLVDDATDDGGVSSGIGSSNPRFLSFVGNTAYFVAENSVNGFELWRLEQNNTASMISSGPTKPGINHNSADSHSSNFFYFDGNTYFSAFDGTNGRELWRVNQAGLATLVEDSIAGGGLNLGSQSSNPRDFTDASGVLYFTADTPSGIGIWRIEPNGLALRISDGLPIGGVSVGQNSPRSSLLTNVNGTVFFVAADAVGGNELWRIAPGATSATRLEPAGQFGGIAPSVASSNPDQLINVNGTLFFVAENVTIGRELWQVSPSGTVSIVEDLVAADGLYPGNIGSQPNQLHNHQGTLYFQAVDAEAGNELWTVDTSGVAVVVENSVPGGGINSSSGSFPREFISVNNTLYFQADDGVNGVELWRVPGSGTAELVDDSVAGGGIAAGSLNSNPRFLANANGTLYFNASDQLSGNEVWRVPPSGIAELVEDANPGGGIAPGSAASGPSAFTNVAGAMYFVANNGTDGVELWRINAIGVAEQVEDSIPGDGIRASTEPSIADRSSLTAVNGTLFFAAEDDVNGIELWSVTGNGLASRVSGPTGSNQILAGSLGSLPTSLTNVNGTLYFSAASGDALGIEAMRVLSNQLPLVNSDNAVVNGSKGNEISNTGIWSDPDFDAVTLNASLGTIVKNLNGTWRWSLTSNTILANQTVTITATDAFGEMAASNFTVNVGAAIANRRVFYNRSTSTVFGNGSGNPINSIDNTKLALLPGQIATTANYTNYSRGINGLVIDIDGASNLSGISPASFQFATWSTFPNATPNFLPIAVPVTVSTFTNGGIDNSGRVKVEFDNNAIQDAWLRVTMLADANTGLTTNDVFYFGNARFDATPASPFPSQQVVINIFDVNIIRARLGVDPGNIANIFDVDRNGVVNVFDVNGVRANQGRTSLRGFTAPNSQGMSMMAAPPIVYKNSLQHQQPSLTDKALSEMTLI
jgi:ELWxxDGT repeat protein